VTRLALVVASTAAIVSAHAGVHAQPGRELTAATVAAIERELKAARVPGASFAIVSGNDTVLRSYGLADAERGVAMTPDTLLQVGSLNKLMTALALGSTLEERQIAFDTAIGKHVTGLSPRLAAATFHQLLSQTSGLRDQAGAGGAGDERALSARVRAIADGDFILPAGTVFSYSNLGYAAAGLALEELHKRPFADALKNAGLMPVGMASSVLRPADVAQRQHAIGHRLDQQVVHAIREFDNDASLWPAGYLWSNASDMSRVLTMLVPGGGGSAISKTVVTRMTSSHAPMPNVFVGGHYGYALMLASDRGTRIYEHGGTQRGFSSLLRIAPDRRFGLVILANLDAAPLRRIAQTVMAEVLELPADLPPSRTEEPVSAAELQTFVGVYRNRGTAEIAVRDGSVALILDGGPPMAVSRIGANRYLARPKPGLAGPEFVLQPATATAPAYLHFALWAYGR
jgi:CubicO group peptidase (beta-lactamase class C family)